MRSEAELFLKNAFATVAEQSSADGVRVGVLRAGLQQRVEGGARAAGHGRGALRARRAGGSSAEK